MEEFSDVSKARASWKVYVEAMTAGREILRRAGVPEPPPIPEFDTIFRLLTPELRQELYTALDAHPSGTPAEAVQIWQPIIRGVAYTGRNRVSRGAQNH